MPARYSDLIDRLLLTPDTLTRIFPTASREIERVLRVREADEAALLGGNTAKDARMVGCLRGLLFYLFDALTDAEASIRDLGGDNAAYISAMIHRRLGDIENAKNLYTRAGAHPAFYAMHREACERSPSMAKQFNWDPYVFVLMCEQYKFADNESEEELIFLQRVEFDHILDYTWRNAILEA